MNDKCQQCGCDMWVEGPVYGMVTRHTPHGFDCINLQLATVTAERDATRESHDRLLKIAEELVGGTDEYWAETEGAGIVRMAHEAIEKGKDA